MLLEQMESTDHKVLQARKVWLDLLDLQGLMEHQVKEACEDCLVKMEQEDQLDLEEQGGLLVLLVLLVLLLIAFQLLKHGS